MNFPGGLGVGGGLLLGLHLFCFRELLLKAVDAAFRVYQFLTPGEEGMAT